MAIWFNIILKKNEKFKYYNILLLKYITMTIAFIFPPIYLLKMEIILTKTSVITYQIISIILALLTIILCKILNTNIYLISLLFTIIILASSLYLQICIYVNTIFSFENDSFFKNYFKLIKMLPIIIIIFFVSFYQIVTYYLILTLINTTINLLL